MIKDLKSAFSKVKSALMRRGRSEPDADDLVQEAWVRLVSHEDQRQTEEPEAFLMRVALNLSIDMHRARQTRGEEVQLEDVVLIDASPTPEDVLSGQERMARMTHCLSRLGEQTRKIFLAHRIDGLSYKEIASQHGLSIGTVEKYVARATAQLMRGMEGW